MGIRLLQFAVNVIKPNAVLVGTLVHKLRSTLPVLKPCMGLSQSNKKKCTRPNKANALSVTKNQRRSVGYTLTTTMKQVKYEDCYATVAMWPWGLLRKM
jgi:hypothetical protein